MNVKNENQILIAKIISMNKLLITLVFLGFFVCAVQEVAAQHIDYTKCDTILDEIYDNSISLNNSKIQARCFINKLGEEFISNMLDIERVNSDKDVNDIKRSIYALLLLLRVFEEENNNQRELIKEIRDNINLAQIKTLVAGVRSPNKNLRINSSFVIANIIDDNFVCVLLDNLRDPHLRDLEHGIKGSANILNLLRVISKWPRKENYLNILTTMKFMTDQIQNHNEKKTDYSNSLGLMKDILENSNCEKQIIVLQDADTANFISNQSIFAKDNIRNFCQKYDQRNPLSNTDFELSWDKQSNGVKGVVANSNNPQWDDYRKKLKNNQRATCNSKKDEIDQLIEKVNNPIQ